MLGIDLNEFNHTLKKVLEQARKDDKEIVKDNSREALKNLVKFTPKSQGHARAGYFPAWSALGLSGAPMTSQPYGRHNGQGKQREDIYLSEGDYEDHTNDPENPHIIIKNKSQVLTTAGQKREEFKKRREAGERISKEERDSIKGQRSKIPYLYLLEKGRLTDEKGQPAGQDKKGFFSTTMKVQQWNFKNFYKNNLERNSAK